MKRIKLDCNDSTLLLFGGHWRACAFSGTCGSGWDDVPSYSGDVISSRGICNHFVLDNFNQKLY